MSHSTRIGVTGSRGFIGNHLVKALEAADCGEVEAFSSRLEDLDAVKQFVLNNDVIFHCAGINRASPEETVLGNILGCYNLLLPSVGQGSTLAKEKRKWFIFTSSLQKDTPYAWSKICCEEMLQASSKAGDIVATVLRLPNIFGPGCRPFYNSVVSTFCHLVAQGRTLAELPVHGDGVDVREYLYVGELVRQMVSLVKASRPSGFSHYEIHGQEYSARDIAQILTDQEKLEHHPYFLQTLASYQVSSGTWKDHDSSTL